MSQYEKERVHQDAETIYGVRTSRSRGWFIGALSSTKNPANNPSCTGHLAPWNLLRGLTYKLYFIGFKHGFVRAKCLQMES